MYVIYKAKKRHDNYSLGVKENESYKETKDKRKFYLAKTHKTISSLIKVRKNICLY